MSHTVSVNVNTEVEIDMADIEEDDLEEELRRRKRVMPAYCELSIGEQANLVERHWQSVQREVTQGRKPAEFEVAFWRYMHGRYL